MELNLAVDDSQGSSGKGKSQSSRDKWMQKHRKRQGRTKMLEKRKKKREERAARAPRKPKAQEKPKGPKPERKSAVTTTRPGKPDAGVFNANVNVEIGTRAPLADQSASWKQEVANKQQAARQRVRAARPSSGNADETSGGGNSKRGSKKKPKQKKKGDRPMAVLKEPIPSTVESAPPVSVYSAHALLQQQVEHTSHLQQASRRHNTTDNRHGNNTTTTSTTTSTSTKPTTAPKARGVQTSDSAFGQLGLDAAVCEAVEEYLGHSEPTEIQRKAIPEMLAGKDVVIRARTGSGKTLAFLLPVFHVLSTMEPRLTRAAGTKALILTPTRELAIQIFDQCQKLVRRFHWLVPGYIIGGEKMKSEKARLRKGVNVLVATPGRLLDHLQHTKSFYVHDLSMLVLDEADRLLDMGFERTLLDITQLLPRPTTRQNVLCSATATEKLEKLQHFSLRQNYARVGFDNLGKDGREEEAEEEKQVVDMEDDEVEAGHTEASSSSSSTMSSDNGAQKKAGKKLAGDGMELEQFAVPAELKQYVVEVPGRLRLASLIGFMRHTEKNYGEKCKMIVFLSSRDSVDFLHMLLTRVTDMSSALLRAKLDLDALDADMDLGALSDDMQALARGDLPPLVSMQVFRLHGAMGQAERTASFVGYAQSKASVLLCTDVAARGLDLPFVNWIVQYDPPGDVASYLHRIGRTARAGRSGNAMLFLMPSEMEFGTMLKEQSHMQMKVVEHDEWLPALASDGSLDADEAVSKFNHHLQTATSSDKELHRHAMSAFQAYVRAYATYPKSVKHIFHPRRLHTGHLAKAFALWDAPSTVGTKKRKYDDSKEDGDDGKGKNTSKSKVKFAGTRIAFDSKGKARKLDKWQPKMLMAGGVPMRAGQRGDADDDDDSSDDEDNHHRKRQRKSKR